MCSNLVQLGQGPALALARSHCSWRQFSSRERGCLRQVKQQSYCSFSPQLLRARAHTECTRFLPTHKAIQRDKCSCFPNQERWPYPTSSWYLLRSAFNVWETLTARSVWWLLPFKWNMQWNAKRWLRNTTTSLNATSFPGLFPWR